MDLLDVVFRGAAAAFLTYGCLLSLLDGRKVVPWQMGSRYGAVLRNQLFNAAE